jgi:hypothetical protein
MSRLSAAAIAAAIFVAPVTAWAQADAYTKVSFSTSQLFDANLFATPASREPTADLVTRFGPALEVGYRWVPVQMKARYELQAERYLDHPDLNKNLAYRAVAVGLGYVPNQRFSLTLDGSDVRTQVPADLNMLSQLNIGRAPARRLLVTALAAYNWSGITTISAGQRFLHENLIGLFVSDTDSSRIGIQHRTSDRSSYSVDYEYRRINFDGSPVTSHVVTAGRTYAITPRTVLEIAAGPRFGDTGISPEITAALTRRGARGEFAITFSRTELTALGERGAIDVRRVAATGSYHLSRRLTVTGTPAYTYHVRGERRVPVYTLDVASAFEVSRQLSLVTSGRFGRQQGMLSGPYDVIPSRSLAVKLLLELPRSAGGDATGRSRS